MLILFCHTSWMLSNSHLKFLSLIECRFNFFPPQIAFRAALLEQENAILRAQILALREELATLQQMICNRANI